MAFATVAEALAAALVVAVLATREAWRRLRLRYEYRWETFAIRSARGRQLLHIRQSEIQSIEPLQIKDRIVRFGRWKRLARTSFARQVVIRSKVAHARPVVVSWEGQPIAGLRPEGYKLRPEETGRKG
jgi:hypothetical protein